MKMKMRNIGNNLLMKIYLDSNHILISKGVFAHNFA